MSRLHVALPADVKHLQVTHKNHKRWVRDFLTLSKDFLCFLLIIRWSIRRSHLFPLLSYPRSQPRACHLSHRRGPYIQTALSLSRKLPQSSRSLSTCPEEHLSTTAPLSCKLSHHAAVTPAESQPLPRIRMRTGGNTSFSYMNAFLTRLASLWTACFHATLPGGIRHRPQEPCGPTDRAASTHCPRELAKQARKAEKHDHPFSIQEHRRVGDREKQEVYSSGIRSPNSSPVP